MEIYRDHNSNKKKVTAMALWEVDQRQKIMESKRTYKNAAKDKKQKKENAPDIISRRILRALCKGSKTNSINL